jgi:zinc ribbon protein
MSSEFIPGKPGTSGSAQKEERSGASGGPSTSPKSAENPIAAQGTPVAPQAAMPAPSKIPWPAMPAAEQKPAATFKCQKCGTDARDVARFCPRCHATLRFECPACGNAQRAGGKCEKCGIDFIKYIGAVVAAKKAEADAVHERLESRSNLLKGILFLPFNGGISLIRHFFRD